MTTYNRTSQSIFKKRITLRDMETYVRLGDRLNKTVFFFGGAGLGKSQKMRQIADAMFPGRKGDNLCDVRLSDKEPSDIAGIAVPIVTTDPKTGKDVTRTVYAVPEFWPTNPDWKGIIFLDELPNAILGTQHSAYQVILDHMAGMFEFPKGCVFVGAGNRDTDNAGTTDMPGPLINRMMILEVDYNLDVWIEDFAKPFNINPIVQMFLKNNPEEFYTGDVENRSTMVYASPRQWETVAGVLDALDENFIGEYAAEVAIAGLVGEGIDTQVMAYYQRAKELPPLEDIFSGDIKEHQLSRDKDDLVYVLCQSGMSFAAKEVMDDSISDEEFIKRLANFVDFMVNNHYERNKDTLMAFMIKIFNSMDSNNPPVLTLNSKRQGLMPAFRKGCTSIMKLVLEYQKRYGEIMKEFNQ